MAFRKEGLGAKDEIRTRDPDLGKVVLYQLSYFRMLQIYSNLFFFQVIYVDLSELVYYTSLNHRLNFIFFS